MFETMVETAVPAGSIPSGQIMDIQPATFAEKFNKVSFDFQHKLQNQPALSMDRLMELFEKTLPYPDQVYWDAGEKDVNQRWNERPGRDFPADQAIERIRENGAWIILFGAERDPEIAALLEESIQEVNELSGGKLFPLMKVRSAYIFITSPRRITTYHIDRECNFLLQIRGEKTIHVFDRYDRDVLPESELETFWTKDNNAPRYRPELQGRAQSTLLKPGTGVHIPVNATHWLQNGDDISVSLSLNFQFKNEQLGNVYRANYYLRKLGLNPTPPGKRSSLDHLKARGMSVPVAAAKAVRRFQKKK